MIKTSNNNHRLKSAVDLKICMLKRQDLSLVWVKSSRENEARFLHQNEVNLCDRETKWPPTHAFAQAAQRKHKIRLAVFYCRPRETKSDPQKLRNFV